MRLSLNERGEQVTQGTYAWLMARLGVPSASMFDKIITPKELKLSKSATPYMAALLAEWLLREPDDRNSDFMERGKELEPRAVKRYESEMETETTPIGFALHDEWDAGASPDRQAGTIGGVEIKVPGAAKHALYLVDPDKLRAEHEMQVQGQLWVTRWEWVDLFSWNPVLPPVRVRVYPNEKFHAAFDEHIPTFCRDLAALKAKYASHRVPEDPKPTTDEDPFGQDTRRNYAANW